MKKIFVFFFMLLTASVSAQTVTFSTLLDEMTDREALAQFPNYVCRQASSYDRQSVAPDKPGWFANADTSQFIRTEKNGNRDEWVLIDAKGPGAIVRWWLTGPHYKNNLYIYIDGAKEPTFTANTADLVGGSALAPAPLSAHRSQGKNLYLPIPYAKSIKVTCDQMPLQKNFYYQIVYRTYPKNVKVESLSKKILADNQQKIADVSKRLLALPEFGSQFRRTSDRIEGADLEKGLTLTGPGLIAELKIKLTAADRVQALRSTILAIQFDGKETVFCPLGDFFGSGVGVNPYKTWYTKVDKDGTMTCWWPMPFKKNAKISFIPAANGQKVVIDRSIVWKSQDWKKDSLYFHCNWRRQDQIKTVKGNGTMDWNYLKVTGRGSYVGDVLALLNRAPDWWGEGDEKIFVDSEKFPSHFGTGSEDYYGYAWGCVDFFEAPFHAQPRVEGPQRYGHTVNLRFRSLDAIPFKENFKFDIEIWHWAATEVDYAAAAFWYGDENARAIGGASRSDVIKEAAKKVLYKTEFKMTFVGFDIATVPGGNLSEQGMAGFKKEGHAWVDNRQLWWTAGKPGQVLGLNVKNEKENATKIVLGLTKAVDYGKVQILLDGKSIGEPIDLFIPKNVDRAVVTLPILKIGKGEHRLDIKIIGKNEKAIGYLFGIDSVRFE